MLAWCVWYAAMQCDAVWCRVQPPGPWLLHRAGWLGLPRPAPLTSVTMAHHGWRGGKAGRGLRSQQRMCKSGVKKSDGDGEPVWAWWPMPAMVPTSRSSARNRHAASMPASWPGPPPTLRAPATPAATGRAQHQERVQVQRGGPTAPHPHTSAAACGPARAAATPAPCPLPQPCGRGVTNGQDVPAARRALRWPGGQPPCTFPSSA